MKRFALALAAVTFFATPSFAEWYEGGTLHRANAEQWQSASSANRLATSGDWASHILGIDTVREIGLDGLRIFALELSSCVTEASSGAPSNTGASELAAACAILLEW